MFSHQENIDFTYQHDNDGDGPLNMGLFYFDNEHIPPPLSWGLLFITMTTNRVSKLRGLELQSWYGGHVIKMWLLLVCCALVQEPECLAILGGHQQTLIFGHNNP